MKLRQHRGPRQIGVGVGIGIGVYPMVYGLVKLIDSDRNLGQN